MRSRAAITCFLLASISASFSGCADGRFENRISLDPVLDPAKISGYSNSVSAIIDALAEDAVQSSGDRVDYYAVTVAGFNFVDDQCALYFDKLFHLDRRRNSIKSGLNSFNRTTNAILAVTQSSTLSMAIVAQAFGLGTGLVDIVAGTYLYQLPPSATLSFVKQTREGYRKGAAEVKSEINSPVSAYNQIQSYLALCQPPTIEAMLSKHVANVAGIPQTDAGSGQVNVVVTSAPTVDVLPVVEQYIDNSMNRLDPPPPTGNGNPRPTAIGNYEKNRMSSLEIRSLQSRLCFNPADGVLGPETREALSKFLRAAGINRSGIHTSGILAQDMDSLPVVELMAANAEDVKAQCKAVGNDPAKLATHYV